MNFISYIYLKYLELFTLPVESACTHDCNQGRQCKCQNYKEKLAEYNDTEHENVSY